MSVLMRLIAVCLLSFVAACTTTTKEGQPLPDLTFSHLQPLPVRVAAVDVVNRFQPAIDVRDVSSSFPSPPDVALQRYADTRLAPVGADGRLEFVIEDAHIYQTEAETGNKFTNWTGLDRSDVYDVTLRLRLYVVYGDGHESDHSLINLHRSLSIPQRYTLDEKEREKFGFLEDLMGDVDRAVTEALISKMNIAGR